jgi:ABC-type thiamin/hydroxymethylpyrimidine transport system permease subunit
MARVTDQPQPEWRWTRRDWLIVGNLGLVSGLVLAGLLRFGLVALMHASMGGLALFLVAAGTNLFLFPSLFAAALLQKPGAALTVQAPSALVIALLTPFGADGLLAGLFFGLIGEGAVAAITRYRSFGWRRMALCGLPAGLLSAVLSLVGHPVVPVWLLTMLAVGAGTLGSAVGSGALAGWLAHRLQPHPSRSGRTRS